jgi:hypothetical protein
LAFNITGFTQALLEPSDFLRVSIGQARMEKTNNWDLLGARFAPPQGACSASQYNDEIASSHCLCPRLRTTATLLLITAGIWDRRNGVAWQQSWAAHVRFGS